AANVEHYAGIVRETATKRRVIHLAGEAARDAGNPSTRGDDLVTRWSERLADLPRSSHGPRLRARVLSNIQPRKGEWLWDKYLLRAAVNDLSGDPGIGKTLVCFDIAARHSRGWAMPPAGGEVRQPERAIILSAEDNPEDTIVPRLTSLGADLSNIDIVDGI